MRVLIVDDEPLARRRLRATLSVHADVEVVGESEDAIQAVQAVQSLRPDVVMLDVQMPGFDGFRVVEALSGVAAPPHVVFVTAFSDHAVRAFDSDAVDYLLKPFTEERLARALDRARAALEARAPRGAEAGEPAASFGSAYRTRFMVMVGRRTVFCAVDEIDWIEADGNYVWLYAAPHRYLYRGTLSGVADELNPRDFVRIHRSRLVRLDRVRELRAVGTEVRAVLRDGTELPVSHRYRRALGW